MAGKIQIPKTKVILLTDYKKKSLLKLFRIAPLWI
jgi:hypothetical protein